MIEGCLQNFVSFGRGELLIIQFKYNFPFFKHLLICFVSIFLFLNYFRFVHSISLYFHVFSSLIYFPFTLILWIAGLELRTACYESGNYIQDGFLCPSVDIGVCVCIIMSCAQRRPMPLLLHDRYVAVTNNISLQTAHPTLRSMPLSTPFPI